MTQPDATESRTGTNGPHPTDDQAEGLVRPGIRHGLIALGWFNVGLGTLGLFLPVLPTTVFLLIALWAFSRSSPRFHHWLYSHPRLGPPLRDWHRHGVISWPAKLTAVTVMLGSLVYITLFVAESWLLPGGLALLLAAVAAFILSRPSRVPGSPSASV